MPYFKWYKLETFTSKFYWQWNFINDVIFQLLLMSAKRVSSLWKVHGSHDHINDNNDQHLLSRSIPGVNFNTMCDCQDSSSREVQ